MKYLLPLLLVFISSPLYAQAQALIRSHNQLTGTGANSHATIDAFISSKGQANGLASLDASGNLVQSAGTVTLSGGYVKQTNGTATGTQLTSVQINSGTGTLSAATIAGVAAPYIAQTNGTGSGITLNTTKLSGNTAIGTTSAATDVVDIDLGSGNMLIQSNSAYPQIQEIRGGSAADGNLLATKIYQGKDSLGNSTNYAGIYSVSSVVTDGNETGAIDFYLSDAGTYGFKGRWKGSNLGIGTSTPQTKLAVNGDISVQSSGYINFGNGTATNGYGVRDNSGIMQYKNNAGTWTDIPSGTSGGGWTDNGTTITENTVTDKVIIGSTTASGSNILTVVGSTTVNDLSISNALGLSFTGTPVIDMAIGDNDTGLNYVSDGIYDIMANNNSVVRIDGNIPNRISVGTITMGTTVNVSGTVTATGFSGNGAGLTGISASKADVKIGTVTYSSATIVEYSESDFNHSATATTGVSLTLKASDTPTANNLLRLDSNGVLLGTLTTTNSSVTGTLTANSIVGSSTAFGQAYRTTSMSSINSTWENIELSGGNNNLINVSHSTVTNPERITVLVPGVYLVFGRAHLRNEPTRAGIRITKNGTEVPGGFASMGIGLGDANQDFTITTNCIVYLSTNDYVTLQVRQDSGGTATVLDIYTGSVPPTTWIYAIMDIVKIGN